MATVHFPPVQLRPFDLTREVFGDAGAAGDDGLRRAWAAAPQTRRLQIGDVADDRESMRMISEGRSAYYLVGLTCAVAGGEHDTLERMNVSVELLSASGEAVAWSVSPLRLTHRPVPEADTDTGGLVVELGPRLQFVGDWAPVAEAERCYVHAVGQDESDPEWRYRRTLVDSLIGPHRICLVVRAPPRVTVAGIVRINARLRHRGALLQSRVRLPDDVAQFTLDPAAPPARRRAGS